MKPSDTPSIEEQIEKEAIKFCSDEEEFAFKCGGRFGVRLGFEQAMKFMSEYCTDGLINEMKLEGIRLGILPDDNEEKNNAR